MLEDPSFAHTVSWAPGGDSFVVKVRPFPSLPSTKQTNDPILAGHERIHKIDLTTHVQAFEFRQLR